MLTFANLVDCMCNLNHGLRYARHSNRGSEDLNCDSLDCESQLKVNEKKTTVTKENQIFSKNTIVKLMLNVVTLFVNKLNVC